MKTEALASQCADKYVILTQHEESYSDDVYSLPLLLHLSFFYRGVLCCYFNH